MLESDTVQFQDSFLPTSSTMMKREPNQDLRGALEEKNSVSSFAQSHTWDFEDHEAISTIRVIFNQVFEKTPSADLAQIEETDFIKQKTELRQDMEQVLEQLEQTRDASAKKDKKA